MSIALVERTGFEVECVAGFSGFGGASGGMRKAGATLRAAANHSELALECYGLNHPETELWQADLVDPDDPQVLNRKGKKVPGRYVDPATLPAARFAWFSPSCFPAGTLVLTKRGLVPIEDVVVGDEAWTHMNRWRPVTAVMSRAAETVVLAGNGNRCLELTPNHRLWARADAEQHHTPYQEAPATCQWCGAPAPLFSTSSTKACVYCSGACRNAAANWKAWHRIGNRVDVPAADMAGKWWATPTEVGDVPLPSVPPDVEWWWLGKWLGDGWTTRSTVTICCAPGEADTLATRLPGPWHKETKRTAVNFTMASPVTAAWLREHFGKGAAEKRLPTWALSLPPCDARRLLDGYVSADGHRDRRGQVACSTVSKALAHGVRLLAVRLGYDATVRYTKRLPTTVIEGRAVSQRGSWVVLWWEDRSKRSKARRVEDHWWGRVGKVLPGRQTTVFNITVDEDHTYVADGIVVHNCTHHSQANAKKIYARGLQVALFDDEDWDQQRYANSERSRVTMSCVLKYTAARHPEIVVVENVIEVTKWGPGGDGSTFKWWMRELDKLGYDHHLCWFNSMFFPPCPQSRDRLYIVAWRKGNTAPTLDYRPIAYCTSQRCGGRIVEAVQTWKRPTAAWVTGTWGKYASQYDYCCPDCSSVVHPASWMALSAIDWSNLGSTLEERIAAGKRPAESTWERIRRAVEKYRNAPPIILPKEVVAAQQVEVAHVESISTSNTGSGRRYADNRVRSVAERTPTLAQRNTVGMVVDGVVGPLRAGRPRVDALGTPFASLVANGSRLALALTVKNNGAVDEVGYRGHHAGEPLGSITAHPTQSVVTLVVPNRTGNVAHHAGETLDPVMTSATEAVVVAASNTHERPGQTRARPAISPLFTRSTTAELAVATGGGSGGEHRAVVTALFSKINGGPGDTRWHGVADPLNTITGGDTTGLVVVPWIEHWQSDPVHVTEQLATITARLRHTLASIEPSEEPITDEQMLSVRFRMLEPDPELRRVMAFDDDYILIGNKGQMTAGLGNAVTPPVAEWITERCLATLR